MDSQSVTSQEYDMKHEEIEMEKQDSSSESDLVQDRLLMDSANLSVEPFAPHERMLHSFVFQMEKTSLLMDSQSVRSQEYDMKHEEIEMEKQDSSSESDLVQDRLLMASANLSVEPFAPHQQMDKTSLLMDSQSVRSQEYDLNSANLSVEPFAPRMQKRSCFALQMDERSLLMDSQSVRSQEYDLNSANLSGEPSEPRYEVRSCFEVQMDKTSANLSVEPFEPHPWMQDCFVTQKDKTITLFVAIDEGNLNRIRRCLLEIKKRGLTLSSDTIRDRDTGKTCLMKALLKPNKNTHIIVNDLLNFTESPHDLKELVNAEYEDHIYEGQTALHIAIEKKQVDMVKLLVSIGADVRARARGIFFHLNKNRNDCFYFGEYPLSLAACTNQLDLVEFLLDNDYNRADVTAQDYLGNTVLHALVTIADDSEENTFVMEMYDWILIKSETQRIKARNTKRSNLEKICNLEGLTPLQLAAKSGKLKILTHILGRIYEDETELDVCHLSRKFVDWAYGPVCCSLYDLSEVDTREKNSVLEMVVYNIRCKSHFEMLNVEPLKELIKVKWRAFAAAMFYVSLAFYFSYIITYSLITSRQFLANQTSEPDSKWKDQGVLAGQVYTFIIAVYIMLRTGMEIFRMCPSKLSSFFQIASFHVLFFIQALLVLCTDIQFWAHKEEYASVLVAFAVVLGWFNILYYSRGFKITGIYSVLLQKMILRDVVRFLIVYAVFLLGFGTALALLMKECNQDESCNPFATFPTAALELFKLTLGLGDLAIHEQSQYPTAFLFLLVMYVILTFVLLLNMLIALMGETVSQVSQDSEKVWKLQRAMTILELERSLPNAWISWFQRKRVISNIRVGVSPCGQDDRRTCLRVNDVNWKCWSEKMRCINEDPGTVKKKKEFVFPAVNLGAKSGFGRQRHGR